MAAAVMRLGLDEGSLTGVVARGSLQPHQQPHYYRPSRVPLFGRGSGGPGNLYDGFVDPEEVREYCLDPIEALQLSTRRVRTVTELSFPYRGVTALHANVRRFENLESLVLTGNRLRDVGVLLPASAAGSLELAPRGCHRLRHLHLSHNLLVALPEDFARLRYVETLLLAHNRLRDLPQLLRQLARLRCLRRLDLFGNPVCEEPGYRATVVAALPWVEVFDRTAVTASERGARSTTLPPPRAGATAEGGTALPQVSTRRTTTGGGRGGLSTSARLERRAEEIVRRREAAAEELRRENAARVAVLDGVRRGFHAVWTASGPGGPLSEKGMRDFKQRCATAGAAAAPAGEVTETVRRPPRGNANLPGRKRLSDSGPAADAPAGEAADGGRRRSGTLGRGLPPFPSGAGGEAAPAECLGREDPSVRFFATLQLTDVPATNAMRADAGTGAVAGLPSTLFERLLETVRGAEPAGRDGRRGRGRRGDPDTAEPVAPRRVDERERDRVRAMGAAVRAGQRLLQPSDPTPLASPDGGLRAADRSDGSPIPATTRRGANRQPSTTTKLRRPHGSAAAMVEVLPQTPSSDSWGSAVSPGSTAPRPAAPAQEYHQLLTEAYSAKPAFIPAPWEVQEALQRPNGSAGATDRGAAVHRVASAPRKPARPAAPPTGGPAKPLTHTLVARLIGHAAPSTDGATLAPSSHQPTVDRVRHHYHTLLHSCAAARGVEAEVHQLTGGASGDGVATASPLSTFLPLPPSSASLSGSQGRREGGHRASPVTPPQPAPAGTDSKSGINCHGAERLRNCRQLTGVQQGLGFKFPAEAFGRVLFQVVPMVFLPWELQAVQRFFRGGMSAVAAPVAVTGTAGITGADADGVGGSGGGVGGISSSNNGGGGGGVGRPTRTRTALEVPVEVFTRPTYHPQFDSMAEVFSLFSFTYEAPSSAGPLQPPPSPPPSASVSAMPLLPTFLAMVNAATAASLVGGKSGGGVGGGGGGGGGGVGNGGAGGGAGAVSSESAATGTGSATSSPNAIVSVGAMPRTASSAPAITVALPGKRKALAALASPVSAMREALNGGALLAMAQIFDVVPPAQAATSGKQSVAGVAAAAAAAAATTTMLAASPLVGGKYFTKDSFADVLQRLDSDSRSLEYLSVEALAAAWETFFAVADGDTDGASRKAAPGAAGGAEGAAAAGTSGVTSGAPAYASRSHTQATPGGGRDTKAKSRRKQAARGQQYAPGGVEEEADGPGVLAHSGQRVPRPPSGGGTIGVGASASPTEAPYHLPSRSNHGDILTGLIMLCCWVPFLRSRVTYLSTLCTSAVAVSSASLSADLRRASADVSERLSNDRGSAASATTVAPPATGAARVANTLQPRPVVAAPATLAAAAAAEATVNLPLPSLSAPLSAADLFHRLQVAKRQLDHLMQRCVALGWDEAEWCRGFVPLTGEAPAATGRVATPSKPAERDVK